MMRIIKIIIIFLFLLNPKAYSAETYAVILSGGYNLENNHYRYYQSTSDMFHAFQSAGIKRENITTLYADGGKDLNTVKTETVEDERNPWTLFITKKTKEIKTYIAPPVSFEGDDKKDIKYPANSQSISQTFDQLAKDVKAGDNIVLYITDHGNRYDGIALWNGDTYSTAELRQQLNKLPDGVQVQIATNICFGGQLLELTSPNVCVVSNSDEKRITTSYTTHDSFTEGMAKKIKESHAKFNKGISFLEIFEAGRASDHPENKVHLTSLDYFIEMESIIPKTTNENATCINQESPISSIEKDISEMIDFLKKIPDSDKSFHEKALQKKLDLIKENLNSFSNQYSQRIRFIYLNEIEKIKKTWATLSEKEKEEKRPFYTEVAEKLKAEDDKQFKNISGLEADQKRVLAELRFLKNATPDQLEKYYSIKRCLEHEI